MLEESPFSPRVVTCLAHRRQRATHLCTDLNCTQSPIICSLCLSDPRFRTIHPHEGNVRPLAEGVQWMTSIIRSQSKSMQLIYQRTIGSRECEVLKFNLEKGNLLFEDLDSRIDNLKMQLEVEMELLVKDFQKQMQLERQQFQRKFQEYKRTFYANIDLLRRDNNELIAFQNSLKYYNNPNSFTLKLIAETQRKSQQWILTQKRVLQRVATILQNPSFTTSAMSILTRVTKSNLFIFPYWKGEKRDQVDTEREMRSCIKTSMGNWVEIPELNDLEGRQYSGSNKYLSYPIPV